MGGTGALLAEVPAVLAVLSAVAAGARVLGLAASAVAVSAAAVSAAAVSAIARIWDRWHIVIHNLVHD